MGSLTSDREIDRAIAYMTLHAGHIDTACMIAVREGSVQSHRASFVPCSSVADVPRLARALCEPKVILEIPLICSIGVGDVRAVPPQWGTLFSQREGLPGCAGRVKDNSAWDASAPTPPRNGARSDRQAAQRAPGRDASGLRESVGCGNPTLPLTAPRTVRHPLL
jgi:hypothetical protein